MAPATYEEKLSTAKKLAKEDPKLVASVIQSWLGEQKKEE
jgi:flagellar biosynthesis/type III secretory pathway M-ring protein FliF/YscJ